MNRPQNTILSPLNKTPSHQLEQAQLRCPRAPSASNAWRGSQWALCFCPDTPSCFKGSAQILLELQGLRPRSLQPASGCPLTMQWLGVGRLCISAHPLEKSAKDHEDPEVVHFLGTLGAWAPGEDLPTSSMHTKIEDRRRRGGGGRHSPGWTGAVTWCNHIARLSSKGVITTYILTGSE